MGPRKKTTGPGRKWQTKKSDHATIVLHHIILSIHNREQDLPCVYHPTIINHYHYLAGKTPKQF